MSNLTTLFLWIISGVAVVCSIIPLYRTIACHGTISYSSIAVLIPTIPVAFIVTTALVGFCGKYNTAYIGFCILWTILSIIANNQDKPSVPHSKNGLIIGWYRTGLRKWHFADNWFRRELLVGFFVFSNFVSGFVKRDINHRDSMGCTIIYIAKKATSPEFFQEAVEKHLKEVRESLDNIGEVTEAQFIEICQQHNCTYMTVQIQKTWKKVPIVMPTN
jgi:hypothetical protein